MPLTDERLVAISRVLDVWENSMDDPDTTPPIELHHVDIKNFRELLAEVERLRKDTPKCEDIGFEHAWRNVTSEYGGYQSSCISDCVTHLRCANCGVEKAEPATCWCL